MQKEDHIQNDQMEIDVNEAEETTMNMDLTTKSKVVRTTDLFGFGGDDDDESSGDEG